MSPFPLSYPCPVPLSFRPLKHPPSFLSDSCAAAWANIMDTNRPGGSPVYTHDNGFPGPLDTLLLNGVTRLLWPCLGAYNLASLHSSPIQPDSTPSAPRMHSVLTWKDLPSHLPWANSPPHSHPSLNAPESLPSPPGLAEMPGLSR